MWLGRSTRGEFTGMFPLMTRHFSELIGQTVLRSLLGLGGEFFQVPGIVAESVDELANFPEKLIASPLLVWLNFRKGLFFRIVSFDAEFLRFDGILGPKLFTDLFDFLQDFAVGAVL